MTTQITITLSGKKAGQLIYFTLEMLKSNFFKVIDMEFETVDQLLEVEKTGLFKIV